MREWINKHKRLNRMEYLALFFCFYSFMGWLLETCYSYIVLGHFTKRGFLYGPVCPIYGYGAVILITFLGRYKRNSLKLFFSAAIVFSVFEYVAGFALDALFAARWWDYTNDFMNLNGRISIFYSFAWGIIAILFLNHIHPFIEKKLKKFLSKFAVIGQLIFLYSMGIAFLIDTILSSIKYLNL